MKMQICFSFLVAYGAIGIELWWWCDGSGAVGMKLWLFMVLLGWIFSWSDRATTVKVKTITIIFFLFL